MQTTPCHTASYSADKGNFQKVLSTSRLGTVFEPKQFLHQREATGVQSSNGNFLVGATTLPIGTGLQTTPCHAAPYWADNGSFRKFGSTYSLGTVFLPQQCLYLNEAMGVESPKCNFLLGANTVQTVAGLQTTPCHAAPYRAGNGNFQKFGSTCCLGTVFAPKRCLYQKEATGVESPKI